MNGCFTFVSLFRCIYLQNSLRNYFYVFGIKYLFLFGTSRCTRCNQFHEALNEFWGISWVIVSLEHPLLEQHCDLNLYIIGKIFHFAACLCHFYGAQTDYNRNCLSSSDIIQAKRPIALLWTSVFDLSGIHKSFTYDAKNGGLGFPTPDWSTATNVIVMSGYVSNSKDDLIKVFIQQTS